MTKKLRERWKQESYQMIKTNPEEEAKKSFTIYKADEDKRLVFGWASVAITVDGEELEDRQHDMIEPEDLEEAAYEYVLNFRDTGEEHLPGYRKKGKLVESCVLTAEKQKAMGIPEGTVPVAWWIGFKIEDDDTWERVKNGTYKMFSIEGKANREPIEKAESTAKTFEEVLKFNPFHDAMGKFSNKHGFKTYSANPKTRAGQMAITRSNAAGHGGTLNVHRESKGENIRQNDDWIKTGRKPKTPAADDLRGAGSSSSKPKAPAKPKTPAKPKKPANSQNDASQAQQKPQGTLAEAVANVNLTNTQKLALQARDANGRTTDTIKVANDHEQARVAGKDISKSFDYDKMKTNKAPIDAIAEAQGWNKEPTVTNDRDLFDKACVQSGRVMMRSVYGDGRKSAAEICEETMKNGNASLGGDGGKVYGSGMYVVDTNIKRSANPTQKVWKGQEESFWYGDKQMMATVHPNAKIATPNQAAKLANDFAKMTTKQRAKFGNDRNTYIASKGYDGAKWHADTDPTAYTTIFNKSALIYYGGIARNH